MDWCLGVFSSGTYWFLHSVNINKQLVQIWRLPGCSYQSELSSVNYCEVSSDGNTFLLSLSSPPPPPPVVVVERKMEALCVFIPLFFFPRETRWRWRQNNELFTSVCGSDVSLSQQLLLLLFLFLSENSFTPSSLCFFFALSVFNLTSVSLSYFLSFHSSKLDSFLFSLSYFTL